MIHDQRLTAKNLRKSFRIRAFPSKPAPRSCSWMLFTSSLLSQHDCCPLLPSQGPQPLLWYTIQLGNLTNCCPTIALLFHPLLHPVPVCVPHLNWVSLVLEVFLPCAHNPREFEQFRSSSKGKGELWSLNVPRHQGRSLPKPRCDTQYAADYTIFNTFSQDMIQNTPSLTHFVRIWYKIHQTSWIRELNKIIHVNGSKLPSLLKSLLKRMK